jgi:hypothetical protein
MDNTHNTGGPAYPTSNWQKMVPQANGYHEGMTLRDYFAAKAMQAMLSSPEFLVVVTADQAVGGNAKERVSNVSFAYADAMLKARAA